MRGKGSSDEGKGFLFLCYISSTTCIFRPLCSMGQKCCIAATLLSVGINPSNVTNMATRSLMFEEVRECTISHVKYLFVISRISLVEEGPLA